MGYTHYFSQKKEVPQDVWDSFTQDVQTLLDGAKEKLGVEVESNCPTGVVIDSDRINLNGIGNLGHETFYFPRDDIEFGFNFCKTARKPYDIVVASILLLANERISGFYEISSDGNAMDWYESMALNAEVFSRGYELPPSFKDDPMKQEVESEVKGMVRDFMIAEKLKSSIAQKLLGKKF